MPQVVISMLLQKFEQPLRKITQKYRNYSNKGMKKTQ